MPEEECSMSYSIGQCDTGCQVAQEVKQEVEPAETGGEEDCGGDQGQRVTGVGTGHPATYKKYRSLD